jgi:hypothetical protein
MKNKVLINFRYPSAWNKVLISKAKKDEATVSVVISRCLERKFGLGKGKVYKPKRDENVPKVLEDK